MAIDYQKILQEVYNELELEKGAGSVASYIPELKKVDASKYGVSLRCTDGSRYELGDSCEKFSTQSIAKVFALALAMQHAGNDIWDRIDVEPSGTSFNSLVLLEYEEGIPRNPFINSGALVVTDILVEHLRNAKGTFLSFVRQMAGDQQIDFNYAVADSEDRTGFRNRALANMLKSFRNINNPLEEVLDLYFHICSVEMNCRQLANAFSVFAKNGVNGDGERVLKPQESQRINALMQTCGFYDEAGEFAFRVGLPGKSGVGGGITAIHPGQYSVAVWSPKLNPQGNLTTRTGMAIF